MDKTKPFGLVLPKRSQTYRPKSKGGIFGSDSDEEPSQKKKITKIPQAKPKKIAVPEQCEDPSIYEYDNIYDEMKRKEIAKAAPKDSNKPSRYIESLLKAADKRKKEQERRVEKKVHHEREREGDKFQDKEAFVTSAYKKKMEEMEEEEERERRENQLNELMDVTKQKDLSGFYRHFLKQSVGEEKVPVFGERHTIKQETSVNSQGVVNVRQSPELIKKIAIKEEKHSDSGGDSPRNNVVDENIDQDSETVSSSDNESPINKINIGSSSLLKTSVVNNKSRKNGMDNRVKGKKSEAKEVPEENIDRDLDIASSSDESTIDEKDRIPLNTSKKSVKKSLTSNDSLMELPIKRRRSENVNTSSVRNIRKKKKSSASLSSHESQSGSEVDENDNSSKVNENAAENTQLAVNSEKDENIVQPQKSRKDIFEKRTIGEVFATAQARYFQRMAA